MAPGCGDCRPIGCWSAAVARDYGSVTPVAVLVSASADRAVFLLGYFDGTVNFGSNGVIDERTSVGSKDVFITKFNADGSGAWTRTFGGPDWEECTAIAQDHASNILIAGNFSSTVDFDPGEGVSERTPEGLVNGFVLTLSPEGTYRTVLTFGAGNGRVGPAGMALDQDDNIFLTGLFDHTVDFDPGAGVELHTSNLNTPDVFVTKLNADGSHAWTRTFGGRAFDMGYQLEVDADSNVFVAGEFRGEVDFDPGGGADVFTALGPSALFLTKLNADGSYGWTRVWQISTILPQHLLARSPDGALYLTGILSGTVDFDPTEGFDFRTGDVDAFVIKVNADGSYGWTRVFPGDGQGGLDLDLAADECGNLLVAGAFTGTMDFDPGPGVDQHTSMGGYDIFLIKLLADGSYAWGRVIGGANNEWLPVVAASAGGLVLAGVGVETTDLDPGCVDAERGSDAAAGEMFVTELRCNQPQADANSDGRVDLLDFVRFQNCFTGPAPTTCNVGCPIFDFDGDDDIDLGDFLFFEHALSTP